MTLRAQIAARARAGLILLAGLAVPSAGGAVTVTIDEAALDAVYAQPSFGAEPVDVRVAPVRTVVSSELARVGDRRAERAVFNLAAGYGPGIGLVFVERIDWCSGYDTEVVGCALRGAPGLFVESDFAAGRFGAEMIAHEIAHNLGLVHTDAGLMTQVLDGDMTLTGAEVLTILASPLVGRDASGRFIDLVPLRIAPVPLPATAPLLAFGALAIAFARRRA